MSEDFVDFIDVTPEAVAQAAAASSFALKIPDQAVRSKKNPSDARWRERVMVVKAGATPSTTKDGQGVLVFELRYRILPVGGSGENNDREFTDFYRANFRAWPNGDKNLGHYKMTEITMARVTELLRAAGIPGDLPATTGSMPGYSGRLLKEIFPADGNSPHLVNRTVDVQVHQRPDEGNPTGISTEVEHYIPEGGVLGGAATAAGGESTAVVSV